MSESIVLHSWKDISAHVGRTERTLQRWEQQFGFPVHRPSGKARSAVFAVASEIQEWIRVTPLLQKAVDTENPKFQVSDLKAVDSRVEKHRSCEYPLAGKPSQVKSEAIIRRCEVLECKMRGLIADQTELREELRERRKELRYWLDVLANLGMHRRLCNDRLIPGSILK